MSRIHLVEPATATGQSKELLDAVHQKLGRTPNLMRVMANAPAALNGYLQFSGALGGGALPARLREQIALAVAEANQCAYCLAAHSAIGKSVGLSQSQIDDARRGEAVEPKHDAAIRFARAVVDRRGHVTADELASVRQAGYDDGAIAEIIANVALNIYTNYINHAADTPVDFPEAKPLALAS